jgi:hypothetical protein
LPPDEKPAARKNAYPGKNPRQTLWDYFHPIAFISHLKRIFGDTYVIYEGNKVSYFRQNDIAWRARTLGSDVTIWGKGCAMTCVAMILKFYGRDVNPGTLDEYLDNNNGYSGNSIIWPTSFKFKEDEGSKKIKWSGYITDSTKFNQILDHEIEANRPVIVHVDHSGSAAGDHYVLVIGKRADGEYIINDPADNKYDENLPESQQINQGGAEDPSDINTIGKNKRYEGIPGKRAYKIVKIAPIIVE